MYRLVQINAHSYTTHDRQSDINFSKISQNKECHQTCTATLQRIKGGNFHPSFLLLGEVIQSQN